MRRFIVLFVVVGILAAHTLSLQAAPQVSSSKGKSDAPAKGKVVPDQYIVVLKEGAEGQAVADKTGVKPKHVYKDVLKGFAAKLNANQLEKLRQNPQVDYIEQDQEITVDATQYSPPWGLDRIDQSYLPLSGSYSYYGTGAGVYAYIIDTGIESSHWDFGGRVVNVYDAFGGNGEDCYGHGTVVAGVVGGATYGVAKGVQLRGVRVLDCNASGVMSGLISALDWIRRYGQRPAVANMSLSGGHSSSLNTATTNLYNAGVFVAVSAGNHSDNACNYSPGNASGAFTVAASDSGDNRASFSDYGSCIDLYAPGVDVPTTSMYGGTTLASGTSLSAPYVAGAAAVYKSMYGSSAPYITNWLINNSTPGVINGNPSGTPNRLLSTAALAVPPPEPTEPMCGPVYC